MSSKPVDELKVKLSADYSGLGESMNKGIEDAAKNLKTDPISGGLASATDQYLRGWMAGLKPIEATYENLINLHKQLAEFPLGTPQRIISQQMLGPMIEFDEKKINFDVLIQKIAELLPLMDKEGRMIGTAFADALRHGMGTGVGEAVKDTEKKLEKLKKTADSTGKSLFTSLVAFGRHPSFAGFVNLAQNMNTYVHASKAYTTAQQQAAGATSNLGQVAGGAGGSVTGLGATVSRAASSIGGMGAVAIIGAAALVGLGIAAYGAFKIISDAIPAGMELIQAQTKLVVVIRTAQRELGQEVGSLAEWNRVVDENLKRFKLLNRIDMTQAAAQVINLGRGIGFTSVQMEQLLHASSLLAVVNNTDLATSIAAVDQALVGGYYRSLVKLGVSIGTSERAQEALELGYKGTWEQLTANERAMVSLNLIIKKTQGLEKDLGLILDSSASQIESATTRLQNSTAQLGKLWAPMAADLKVIGTNIKTWITDRLGDLVKAFWDTAGGIATAYVYLENLLSKGMGSGAAWTDAKRRVGAVKDEFTAAGTASVGAADDFKTLDDIVKQLDIDANQLADSFEDLGASLDSFHADTLQADVDWASKDVEIWQDWGTKVEEINKDHYGRLAEINIDYYDSVADANASYGRHLARAEEDYNRNIQKADEDYQRTREENAADFRERQQQEEENHQKEMKRLTDDYADDISDAMRKRDARAVIDLTKNYLKQRGRAEEDYAIRRKQEQEDQAKSEKRAEEAYQRQRKDAEEAY